MEYTALGSKGRFLLSFGNMAQFTVSFEDRSIALAAPGLTGDPAALNHLLYDHVIPRVIAATGVLVLHGSAVEIGGRLAIFIGETGTGKSTLSASLHSKGHRLIGDDAVIVTCVNGAFEGESVYPSLRLYPEAIEQVLGPGVPTAMMAGYSDKRHVIDFGGRSQTMGVLPIGHLFFLVTDPSQTSIRSIAMRDVCMALIEQSFALDPKDVSGATERMRQASALAASVPAHVLRYPHDYAILPQVHQLIENTMGVTSPNRDLPIESQNQ